MWLATLSACVIVVAACGRKSGDATQASSPAASATTLADDATSDSKKPSSALAQALLGVDDLGSGWSGSVAPCEVDPALPRWSDCAEAAFERVSTGHSVIEQIAVFPADSAEQLVTQMRSKFGDPAGVAWQLLPTPSFGDQALAARYKLNLSFDEQAFVRRGNTVITVIYHAPRGTGDDASNTSAAESIIRAADARAAQRLRQPPP